MKKKFFSKLLMVALVATVGVFSSCKDYDDDIADVRNNLSQTATELRTDYTNKINAVNTKIETLQTSYDKLSKALDESNAQLQTLINTKFDAAVKAAEAYSDANLVKAKDAAAAAEAAAKAYAETQAAAAQSAAIAAAKEQVAAAKAELEAALAKANELIATQGQSIANLIEADKTLDLAIKAAQARADEAYALADKANTLAETNKTNIDKAAADIAALQKSLSALESKAADKADVAKLQSDLAALQKQVGETVVNLADYKESIANITSELAKLKSDLEQQVSFLGENLAGVKKTAEANAASIESIITQLSELKKANDLAHQELANSVSTLDTKTSNAINALDEKTSKNLASAVQGIEAEIKAANKLISDNTGAIASLTQTVENNKKAQDAINEAIKSDIALKAEQIVANTNAIKRLNEIIPELQSTLEKYADKVAGAAAQAGKDAAAAAQETAQKFALDAIAAQAELDEKAWNKAIDIAVKTLVETYELATLKETLQAYADHAASTAQNAAETNAAAAAQKISDKALETAMTYTDKLAQTLQDNYTQTVDMQKQIEAAKNAAIAQAYKEVLNKLLDGTDWASLIEQDKDYLTGVVPPSILSLIKGYVDEIGLSPEKIQDQIDTSIESFIEAAMTPSAPAEMGKPAVEAGIIMAAIEAAAKDAADNLKDVNDALDARLDKIEAFLTTISGKETLDATIQYWIADLAKQADLDDVVAQLKGEKDGDLKKIIDNLKKADADNAADVEKIMTSINKVTGMFAALLPAAEGDIDTDLAAYEAVMQALADRIFAMADVVDNLDDYVMNAVNKNLGPQIQSMITSINLFANQHMAEFDEKGHIAYWNGDEWEYPDGYEGFDHTLTFCYTIERGILNNLAGELKKEEWNYPTELIDQLKEIKSSRDALAADYDYTYGGKVIQYKDGKEVEVDAASAGFDFRDGRYRSYEDKILVRVSPTNADLKQAWKDGGIALLNSKGEDLITEELIEVLSVYPYESDKYVTRFYPYNANGTRADEPAANKQTGLWVIEFKMKDENVGEKYAKFAQQDGNDILYAVAVKNTNFATEGTEIAEATEDVDRYVVSEYDLSLATEEAKHVYDFDVNDININKIHNRYITPDEAQVGTTNFTDDPKTPKYKNGFRYELTWHPLCDTDVPQEEIDEDAEAAKLKAPWYGYCWECCFDDYGKHNDECYENDKFIGKQEIGYTTIFFEGSKDNYEETDFCGVNTCDRHDHVIGNVNAIEAVREDNGVDNRHKQPKLPIEFTEDLDGDGKLWAKIEIEFPSVNKCGERTPIRGFFVTLDQHFAVESNNSEINSWVTYEYKNVSKYNYNHGVKQVEPLLKEDKIILQKGNKGVIYIKDEHNVKDGDVIGFRVHAVNLDGTITDPDGRAFYVEIGKKETQHKLTFSITPENYNDSAWAVQNWTVNGEETLDFKKVDNKNGKNPIVTFNEKMTAAKLTTTFFNRPLYGELIEGDEDNYEIQYTWREGNPAIRGAVAGSTNAYWPLAGTGAGVETEGLGTGTYIKYADGDVKQDSRYDVEKFFTFQFSTLANPDVQRKDANGNNQDWCSWNEKSVNGYLAPSAETQSVRASINPKMADRLIDGETYKVTMTILRKATRFTAAQVVNSVDIDIKKVMPTGLPTAFKMKSGQQETIKEGIWTIYVRPMLQEEVDALAQNGDVEEGADRPDFPQGDPQNAGGDAAKAWEIGWTNFNEEFDTDRTYDKDNKQWTALENGLSHHRGRWAVDARPWTIDEMFEGIIIENEDGSVKDVDKNYYFVFVGAGDLAAASKLLDEKGNPIVAPKDNSKSVEAIADALYADKNGITLYNKTTVPVNPGTTASQQGEHEAGYRVAPVYYKHLGDSKAFTTYPVKAGYVYKQISATLDKSGKKFVDPVAKAEIDSKIIAENGSLTIDNYLNQDFIIAPVQVKTYDNKDLKTRYFCSIVKAVELPNEAKQSKASEGCTLKDGVQQIPYVKGGAVDIFTEYLKTKVKSRDKKFFTASGSDCAYFDAQLDDVTDNTTIDDLVNNLKYYWIDYSSLTVNGVDGNDPYELKQYYSWHFAATDAQDSPAISPADTEKNKDIKYLVLVPKYRENALPHLSKDYTGITVSFNMYHKWYNHGPLKVTVKGATILKPENQPYAGRQAR